jgi:hypothetical protein
MFSLTKNVSIPITFIFFLWYNNSTLTYCAVPVIVRLLSYDLIKLSNLNLSISVMATQSKGLKNPKSCPNFNTWKEV